ncbi:MAG: hypothetical protein V4657_02895 [Pseudomonadota bacterium]
MPGPLVAGVVSSVASGAMQSSAAKKAAGAQTAAANDQIAETRRQFDLVQSLLKPYVTAGTSALQGQLDLLGMGGGGGTAPGIQTIAGVAGTPGDMGQGFGTAAGERGLPGAGITMTGGTMGTPERYSVNGQTFNTMEEAQTFANANKTGGMSAADAQRNAISGLANGEGFKALVQQGEYGLMANAAATGGLRGGDTQGALAQFRPAMLQGLIDRQLASLGGIAANGQSAATNTGQAAQNAGQQVNQSRGDIGSAQAGAALAGGRAWSNAGSGILQTLGGLAQPMTPGGGAWQKWQF